MKISIGGKIVNVSSGSGGTFEGIPFKGILTQEEYDALPESEQISGFYIVDDGSSGSSGGGSSGSASSLDVYSTEERQIGYWTDGKPLYRRVFQLTTGSSEDEVICSLDRDVNVTFAKGNIVTANGGKMFLDTIDSNNSVADIYIDVDNHVHFDTNYIHYYNRPLTICFEYTKTTDTPVGTIPPTSSEPSFEIYDDEERVIGTWFGKPLYRKTYSVTSPSSNSAAVIVPLSEVDVVNISGYLLSSTGNKMILPSIEGSYAICPYVSANGISLALNYTGYYNRPMTVILEYTKTTD